MRDASDADAKMKPIHVTNLQPRLLLELKISNTFITSLSSLPVHVSTINAPAKFNNIS